MRLALCSAMMVCRDDGDAYFWCLYGIRLLCFILYLVESVRRISLLKYYCVVLHVLCKKLSSRLPMVIFCAKSVSLPTLL